MTLPNDFLYDKRIVARHVTQGFLSPEELERATAALPDLAAKSVTISVKVEPVTVRITQPGQRREEPRLDEAVE